MGVRPAWPAHPFGVQVFRAYTYCEWREGTMTLRLSRAEARQRLSRLPEELVAHGDEIAAITRCGGRSWQC
jgi:hypothetical protein